MATNRHIDPAVPVITEQHILKFAKNIEVREVMPMTRDSIAYRLALIFICIGAGLALATLLGFAVLVYRDPEHAANHVDVCLKLFQGVMSYVGGPAVLSLILGYLFGRQEKPDNTDDKSQ